MAKFLRKPFNYWSAANVKTLTMKSATVTLITLVIFTLFFSASPEIRAQEPYYKEPSLSLDGEAAILTEAHTGRVLFEQNADQPMHPASITKIMTLLLTGEALGQGIISLDDVVITSEQAWATGGSQLFLELGQEVTVQELIEGIAIVSANDACVSIAEHISGSVSVFVDSMNDRARELGLASTTFANTHGLHDPAQVTTAGDIARLARFFINSQPDIFALQSEREYIFNEIRQYNRNPLLGHFDGADGLKTGYLNEAGWCLAATAQRGDFRLISVVLNASSSEARRDDSQVLLNYGFSNYELFRRAGQGERITTVEVPRGQERTVNTVAANNIDVVIPRGQEHYLREEIISKGDLAAPVEKGEPLAKIKIFYADKQLVETELLAGEDVERLGFFANAWRSIGDFFSGLFRRES